jgi:hypothetical protein
MRQHERVRTPGHVTFARLSLDEARKLEGTGAALDLSEHGIRMTADGPLERGDLVRLDVALADGRVEVEARVMRVGAGEVGLQFEGISLGDQARIRRFIAEHRPRFGARA